MTTDHGLLVYDEDVLTLWRDCSINNVLKCLEMLLPL